MTIHICDARLILESVIQLTNDMGGSQMNIMSVSPVTIMWKEILIIFTVLFFVRVLIDVYMLKQHQYILNEFYLGNYAKIISKAEKLRKVCDIFSAAPYNKKTCLMYNNLCCVLASIGLLYDKESVFLDNLYRIKREETYELKSFLMALYFFKRDSSKARTCYDSYLQCKHENANVSIIMKKLFTISEDISMEQYTQAKQSFNNPVIMKMLEDINN